MKAYIHNPKIYQHHFKSQLGSGLPGFEGTRMHRQQWGSGIGSMLAKLARKAIPLLISGAKLAKPHVVKAAKGIAKDVTKTVLDKASTKLFNKKRKAKRAPVRRRKKVKQSTSHDIFS